MPEDLQTEDIEGVEILSVGGPIHGKGSPPEGDFYTEDDLRAMADADTELGDELKPPARINKFDDHSLQPAVGWIENVRTSDDGTKLLADVRKVPAKLAKVIRAGGYRTRSVELSKITSQKTGKTFEWVVTGLTWLGGKLPAVRTLDDVVALYDGADIAVRRVYQTGDLIWDPDEGLEAWRRAVDAALNPGPGDARYWVRDVTDGKALVEEYRGQEAWVVPFTRDADGSVEVAPSSDWTPAEQAWVESVTEYARKFAAASDSRSMPTLEFNEEQRAAAAEKLGVKADELTSEKLLEHVFAEAPKPDEGDGGSGDGDGDEAMRALEAKVDETKRELDTTREELRTERKRAFVDDIIRQGKEEPGRRAQVETLYDKLGADEAAKWYEGVKPDETLAREFGSDDDGNGEPTVEQKRALEAELAEVFPGYDAQEVPA